MYAAEALVATNRFGTALPENSLQVGMEATKRFRIRIVRDETLLLPLHIRQGLGKSRRCLVLQLVGSSVMFLNRRNSSRCCTDGEDIRSDSILNAGLHSTSQNLLPR